MSHSELFRNEHLQANLGQRAVRGGAVLVVAQGIQFVLSTASTIILARLLCPEDFGLVAMVLPFIGLLGFLRDSGLHMATIQQETIDHHQVSTLFWFNLALAFMLMLVLVALSPAISWFFGREELLWLTLAYAVNMLVGGASIQHSALLNRQMAFGELTAIAVAAQVVGLLVGVLGGLLGWSYWALAAMAISTTTIQTILTWCFCRWVPGLPRRGTGAGRMLLFGGGLTISNLLYCLTQYVDALLIGRLLGAVPLGFYNRASQLYLMPLSQLMGPLGNVSIPALSRLADSPERYLRAYLRAQEKLLILTAAFSAFLIVYGDAVVRLLLGPQWTLAGYVLQAFAIGGLIAPLSSTVSWLLVTQGRSRDLACWSPFGLLLRCAAILCGFPWGVVGIAASIALFQYVSSIAFTLWAGRKGPVTSVIIWRNMTAPLAAAAAGVCTSFPVKLALADQSSLLSLSLGAVAYAGAFLSVLWIIPAGKSALVDMRRLAGMALGRFGSQTL